MKLLLQIDADLSGCATVGELVPLARFLVSTYTPEEGQWLWHEQLCCPNCGKVWCRRVLIGEHGLPLRSKWVFTPSYCGEPMLTKHDYAYLLSPQYDHRFNRQQQEFLLYDYPRSVEHSHYGHA